MSKHTKQDQGTTTLVQNATAPVTVLQPATLRAKRIAAVQVALHARYRTGKRNAHIQATHSANLHAYQLRIAELQAEYGITAANPQIAGSAVQRATQHAPSKALVLVNGVQYPPVKAVHALYVLHNGVRKAVLAAAHELGINPSTAATQYAVAKKAAGN